MYYYTRKCSHVNVWRKIELMSLRKANVASNVSNESIVNEGRLTKPMTNTNFVT